METTYSKYKGYFDRRIVSESNPGGQFLISKRTNYILEQSRETGLIEQRKNTMEAIENDPEIKKLTRKKRIN